MTDEIKRKIDNLSQIQIAKIIRFAPPGYELCVGEAGDYLYERFKKLGGMTPAISKMIGWERNV